MHSPSNAVSLSHVSRVIAGRNLLADISLDLAVGEFFALVGPSGSGKSTLLKMISGIDPPTKGEVWIDGQNVTQLPPYQRPVHTVFQNYALFPHLSVADNVAFPLKVAGVTKADSVPKVTKALRLVRLEAFANRSVTTLSGGERQRVAVARALVDEPKCVLFDEPLAALDPHLRSSTLEMIQEIQQRLGLTYVYVTHDRQEALKAAHRCALLKEGRLVQVGTPQELYQRPATAFAASFMGPIHWVSARRTGSRSLSIPSVTGMATLEVTHELRPEDIELVVGLRPEGVRIGSNEPLQAKLEGIEFCGATSLVKLRLENGEAIVAETRGGVGGASPGDLVRVGWSSQSMHVFPKGMGVSPERKGEM